MHTVVYYDTRETLTMGFIRF